MIDLLEEKFKGYFSNMALIEALEPTTRTIRRMAAIFIFDEFFCER
jgi:hypothetical protein